jgi:lipoyl(octanoyl) transferase
MLDFIDWGLISYSEAYNRQKALFEAAVQDKASRKAVQNQVIFCEHPHVITIGKHGLVSNLLFPEPVLRERNVELYRVDRGGDVTYHGPGQQVVYPLVDLESFSIGLKEYVHRLEEIIIRAIGGFGIRGERLPGATGVWVDIDQPGKARKIAAIGVRSSRYITMHGFALNVHPDLSYFQLINPCGFTDKGVTSMEKESACRIEQGKLKELLVTLFQQLFEAPLKHAP